MIQFFVENLWLIWTIIAIVCLTLEISSGDFYITCFAVGAFCTAIVSLLCPQLWAQALVFAACSVVSIWVLRPRILTFLEARADRRVSNADALLGRVGEVTEPIEVGGYGRVKIDGDYWKAESDATDDIALGEKVRVVGRESIIIKVERV